MDSEAKTRICPGDSLIKPADCARQRFGRSARWIWLKLKTDPTFPRPVYLDGKSPSFISREIDEYLTRCAGEKAAA